MDIHVVGVCVCVGLGVVVVSLMSVHPSSGAFVILCSQDPFLWCLCSCLWPWITVMSICCLFYHETNKEVISLKNV